MFVAGENCQRQALIRPQAKGHWVDGVGVCVDRSALAQHSHRVVSDFVVRSSVARRSLSSCLTALASLVVRGRARFKMSDRSHRDAKRSKYRRQVHYVSRDAAASCTKLDNRRTGGSSTRWLAAISDCLCESPQSMQAAGLTLRGSSIDTDLASSSLAREIRRPEPLETPSTCLTRCVHQRGLYAHLDVHLAALVAVLPRSRSSGRHGGRRGRRGRRRH
jgi:hypothetical protein